MAPGLRQGFATEQDIGQRVFKVIRAIGKKGFSLIKGPYFPVNLAKHLITRQGIRMMLEKGLQQTAGFIQFLQVQVGRASSRGIIESGAGFSSKA